jgi:ketopantoate hydroxymethyltransferase
MTLGAVADAAGADIILVGDMLGMVVLYDTTIPVTMDEMLHHVKAVTRGPPSVRRGRHAVHELPGQRGRAGNAA